MRAPEDLRAFIAALEAVGELHRVAAEVDPYLEIAAITAAVSHKGEAGKGLFFETVKGGAAPVVTNLFGSARRMARIFGAAALAEVTQRLRLALAALPAGAEPLTYLAAPFSPRESAPLWTRDLAIDQVACLPLLTSWPKDGGRYLTLPQVFTRAPEGDGQNCGMYRLQLLADGSFALHCKPGSGAACHLAAWHERGVAMPVAIALGGPPVLTWLAGLPLPETVDDLALAGFFSAAPLSVATTAQGLRLPATAEYLLEGEILPGETAQEGPFGNHTGFYVPQTDSPRLRLTRLRHRPDPLYPCTVVGPPPMEDCAMAAAAVEIFLPLLQRDCPWLHDLYLPPQGIFHGAALLAIDATAPDLESRCAALEKTLLLRKSRLLLFLPAGIDLRDGGDCFWRALNRVELSRDLQLKGGRLVIDATASDGREELGGDAVTKAQVADKWRTYGFLE